MSNLENYVAQLNNLMSENASTISRCEARIEALNAAIVKAGEDMVAATETVDTDAFKEAKSRRDDSQLELEMLQKSMKKLREEPLMTVEAFETMRMNIIAEQETFTETCKEKYAPMIREMLADLEAAAELDNTIENILEILHRKIMRITGSNNQQLKNGLEKYRYSRLQLDAYPIQWFLNNLKNEAEEIGIE